jgi:hypothetical protein
MANSYPYTGVSTSLPTVGGDNGTWGEKLNNFLVSSHTASGFLSTISSQTSAYTMGQYPGETVLANATSGAFNVTLPDATLTTNFYTVKKTDSSTNAVTVNTTSSQTIDGGSTAVLTVQYASITVVSNSTNWYVI